MRNCRTYKFLSLCLFCFLLSKSTAQIPTYTLKGEFKKVPSGKVYLVPAISDKKYYNGFEIDSANIINGKFVINRKSFDNSVKPYRIIVRSELVNDATNLVFLSSINQVIIFDSINEYISPVIKSSSIQNEMKYGYDKFFKKLVRAVYELENYSDELYKKYGNNIPEHENLKVGIWSKELSKKGDSLFFVYARQHTNSHVTMWKLIERFKINGFKNEYLTIYNLLSGKIKKTTAASFLFYDLQKSQSMGIGSFFPKLQLQTLDKINLNLELKNNYTKYTLIDFWFNSCGPCLKEFPQYKDIYYQFKTLGFEIIGISIDKKDDFYK